MRFSGLRSMPSGDLVVSAPMTPGSRSKSTTAMNILAARGLVVKKIDAAKLRIVIAAVLALSADAVLVAHDPPNFVPIWLPHWPTCMCEISREEIASKQEAHGSKKAGSGDAVAAKQLGSCAAGKSK